MKAYSCSDISNFAIRIQCDASKGELYIEKCCEPLQNRPLIKFKGNAEETWRELAWMQVQMLGEGISDIDNATERRHTSTCVKCANYCFQDWPMHRLVNEVGFAMYPAPCNCHCCYCGVNRTWVNTPEIRHAYENAIEVLEYGVQHNIIHPNAGWNMASGEITVHPYHDRLLSLIKGHRTMIPTNGLIYDPAVAQHLKESESSFILVSVDAGTENTWRKVKGVASINRVIENLNIYRAGVSSQNQVRLKYILLPGVNDGEEDFVSILKYLDLSYCQVSRNNHYKYAKDDIYHNMLIKSAIILKKTLEENNIDVMLSEFTPDEVQMIERELS